MFLLKPDALNPHSPRVHSFRISGRRWVWGDVQCVRNLRSAGRATITVRRREVGSPATTASRRYCLQSVSGLLVSMNARHVVFVGELRSHHAASNMPTNRRRKRRPTIATNEPTNELYLGMLRGDIVWNHQTERWERRNLDKAPPWWKFGIDNSNRHSDSPVSLPKQPPPHHDSLPAHETPGALTHDQLIRIQQINDLANRGVITDAVRDDEVNTIASEDH